MLIHADQLNRGDAPVELYHHDAEGAYVVVGDALTHVLITRSEAGELRRILEEHIKPGAASSGDGSNDRQS